MIDKNGIRINAGDIVQITGAYFKNDNGFYYVEQDGTNPGYAADDTQVTLKKICRNGKISTTKYNIAFFPLHSYCSDPRKNAAADEWNKEHAAIEIIKNIDNSQVLAFFEDAAKKQRETAEYYSMRGYDWEHWCKQYEETAAWYEGVVERMSVKTFTPEEFAATIQ